MSREGALSCGLRYLYIVLGIVSRIKLIIMLVILQILFTGWGVVGAWVAFMPPFEKTGYLLNLPFLL